MHLQSSRDDRVNSFIYIVCAVSKCLCSRGCVRGRFCAFASVCVSALTDMRHAACHSAGSTSSGCQGCELLFDSIHDA